MTTVLIDDKSVEESNILEYVKRKPHVAQFVHECDNTPLPVPEEELISLEEFKAYMEELAYKRFGLNLTL
jgi:hypothetical protein